MARIYKYSDKTWYDVPDSEAQTAVANNEAGLETGLQLPVVNPSGQHTFIDSNEAAKAFQTGYRFQTLEDLHDKYNTEMHDAMQKRMAEIPGTAFMAAALGSATGGLSDLPGVLAKGDQYKEARESAAEANPIANVAGEVTGLVAPVGIGGVASKLGSAVERGIAFAPSLTSKIVGHSLRGITEGAVLGTGEDVSDAIMGNPDDAVDNLLSHVGHDALLGGALGSMFGIGSEIVAPAVKSAALFGYKSGTDLVRKAAGKGLEATLSVAGKADVLAAAKRLGALENPEAFAELTALYEQGGKTALDSAESNVGNLTSQIETQQNTIGKQLAADSKDLSKEAAGQLKAVMGAADNDVAKARETLMEQIKAHSAQFDTEVAKLETAPVPPTADQVLSGALDGPLERAAKWAKDPASRAMVEKLEATSNLIQNVSTQAELVRGLKQLREFASARGVPEDQVRKAIMDLRTSVANVVEDGERIGLPKEISTFFRDQAAMYDASKALGEVVKGKSKSVVSQFVSGGDVSSSQMEQVLNLLPNAGEYLKTLAKTGASSAQKELAFKSVYQDYLAHIGDARLAGEKALHPEVVRDIFEKVAAESPNIKRGLENLKDLGDLRAFQGTPLEKEILLRSALGQDVSKMENFLPHEQRLRDLDIISKASDATKAPTAVRQAAAFATGGKSEVLMAAINAARNPYNALQKLTKMKQLADKGQKILSNAMDHTTRALLSNKVEKVARADYIQSEKRSEADQMRRYKQVKERVVDLSTPEALTNHMAQATSGSESAPNIKMALSNKLANSVIYLKAQLPHDPLEGTSIFSGKSDYEPSMAEVSRFNRQITAVQDPVSVVHRIADGTCTPEELDALKTVHPGIYNRLQASIMSGIMDHGSANAVPYDRRIQLSVMFGIPTDYTMKPAFIQAMQNNLKPADEGGRPDGAKDNGSRKPRLDLQPLAFAQTDSDKITYKE